MDPKEIDIQLDELENRLDRLRALYEQYFLGIEKIEPGVSRKDVDRRFWLLRRLQIRNTARRFRLQVLVQRYNTFQQYWTRICREIENGTYVRHLLKAQKSQGFEPKTWAARKRLGLLRNGAGKEPEAASVQALTSAAPRESAESISKRLEDLGPLDLDLDDDLDPAPAPRPGPVARPVAPAEPAPKAAASTKAPSTALTDDRVRRLHAELIAARRQLRQPDNVSLDSFARSLRDTESKLLAQHRGGSVEFQVVVKDGKSIVKPVVRK